jgi:hypothetical protein
MVGTAKPDSVSKNNKAFFGTDMMNAENVDGCSRMVHVLRIFGGFSTLHCIHHSNFHRLLLSGYNATLSHPNTIGKETPKREPTAGRLVPLRRL